MSSEKLYYKKYLKYKQKYKILQNILGGEKNSDKFGQVSQVPRPFEKKKSLTYSYQGNEGTCFAHSIARIFANLIKLFLLNNFDYTADCSYFYDTMECKFIFDCFSMNKINNCDNYQEHISALLFHFIYVILIEEYGCWGAQSILVILYFVDYIKNTKITSDLIIKKLYFNSNRRGHSNYPYLIEKLNDIINKAKSYLFNNTLNVYSVTLKKQVLVVYKYDLIKKIYYLKENHALKKLLKTNELKNTLIHILNNGYYATFRYGSHIVIITEYDADMDALVIKNSHGAPKLSDTGTSNWCPIIKNNRILFTDLLNKELDINDKWQIFFLYSTIKPTPIMLFPEFESRLETIKTKINEINEYILTSTSRQKITVEDIEENLKYINSNLDNRILKAIHSIKVTKNEILDVKNNLIKLKKDSLQFNKTIDLQK